jgi:tetratricopeptide (TPR) repeat protein
VSIDGKKLGAGTYRFVVIPSKTGDWALIFNTETKNWGTVYEAKFDTLKLMVKPETAPNEEWMSFSLTDLTPSSARVVLAWEKIRLSFKVEFNLLGKLQMSMGNWQLLNGAARFALDNKMYPEEGLTWVERSIALDKNARNLQTKAELLAQTGKIDNAIAAAEEAVKLAKAKDPKANTTGLEKMITDWKAKK